MALDLYKHNVGLSWGFSMKISKFIYYARAAYHAVGPMHTFSVLTNLSKFRENESNHHSNRRILYWEEYFSKSFSSIVGILY